jgi:hypothetical protein
LIYLVANTLVVFIPSGSASSKSPYESAYDHGCNDAGKFRVADIDESKHQKIEELKRDNPDATILDTAISEG